MTNGISVYFDDMEDVLNVEFPRFDEIIKDGKLTDEFMDKLYRGYKEAEDSERKEHMEKLSPIRKVIKTVRETIGKRKGEYKIPVKEIHLYPTTRSNLESDYIINVIDKSYGSEAEYHRIMADRWKRAENIVIGVDLTIDIAATITGVYRGISTGDIKEGFAGFGYLATFGMLLLVGYFIAGIKGEEPHKRESKYFTHITGTPVKLHRHDGEVAFYPNSGEMEKFRL